MNTHNNNNNNNNNNRLTGLFFPVYLGQPRLWPSHNIFLHLDLSQASSNEYSCYLIYRQSIFIFQPSYTVRNILILILIMPPQPCNIHGAYNKIAEDVKRRLINTYVKGEDYMAAVRMLGVKVATARSIIVRHNTVNQLKTSPVVGDKRW